MESTGPRVRSTYARPCALMTAGSPPRVRPTCGPSPGQSALVARSAGRVGAWIEHPGTDPGTGEHRRVTLELDLGSGTGDASWSPTRPRRENCPPPRTPPSTT